MRRRMSFAGTAALLMLTGCGAAPDLPREAPELAGADLAGVQRDLADLHGKTVLVTVWASWCAPCRDEAPLLQAAQESWGEENFTVLGINFRDNEQTARAFEEKFGVTYASVIDLNGSMAVEWGVSGIPQSFLVDGEGNIVAHQVGPVTESWIQKHVPAVLDE